MGLRTGCESDGNLLEMQRSNVNLSAKVARLVPPAVHSLQNLTPPCMWLEGPRKVANRHNAGGQLET